MFKSRRPRRFGYTPVYFDEDKARVQERRDLIEVEMGVKEVSNDPHKRLLRMRSQFSASREELQTSISQKANREQKIRFIVIFGVLCVLIYSVFLLFEKASVLAPLLNNPQ